MIKVKSVWLRKIHKWVGLVIGLQFLLWAVSGLAMALIAMEEVAGGPMAEHRTMPLPTSGAWPQVQAQLAGVPVSGLAIQQLPTGPALMVTSGDEMRLFDAATGQRVTINAAMAASVASAAHPDHGPIVSVRRMDRPTLAVREHELPIWQVDFADDKNSSYYVSGTTGELIERRNDAWRWWDFFWMLHNMDYWQRTSFNHPLIVLVTFASAWLAVTGFWLLFRVFRRSDFGLARRNGRRR